MKEPVPRDMDGRVLQGLFEESFSRENELRLSDAGASGSGGRTGGSDEDEQVIAERLKALGYLE
jgi:hypothetical protein